MALSHRNISLRALLTRTPRYEADDFGAAFVRANKEAGGGIRLMSGTALDQFPSDIEFWYEVYGVQDGDILVRANRITEQNGKLKAVKMVECSLSEFKQWAEAHEKAA